MLDKKLEYLAKTHEGPIMKDPIYIRISSLYPSIKEVDVTIRYFEEDTYDSIHTTFSYGRQKTLKQLLTYIPKHLKKMVKEVNTQLTFIK